MPFIRTSVAIAALPALVGASLLATPRPAAAQGTLIYSYSFPKTHGALRDPTGPLVYVNGTFYGETAPEDANGAIYRVSPTGAVSTIHGPGLPTETFEPRGGLTYYSGKLYGVSYVGGTNGRGYVFSLAATGAVTTIYSFAATSVDAYSPVTQPIVVNGVLYGITEAGGTYGMGAIYAVTLAGAETVLRSFAGGTDGADPQSPLLALGTTLYGTTQYGGGSPAASCLGGQGCGTLYATSLAGNETVLHVFTLGDDGGFPASNLIAVSGTIYGVAPEGGTTGCGTAYTYTPGGAFTTVHSFTGVPDACNPRAGFANLNGTLYGTTPDSGTDGLVYAMSLTGQTSIIFNFDTTDGSGGNTLLAEGNALWGAALGGAANEGAIFGIRP